MSIVPFGNTDLCPEINTLTERITGAIGTLWRPLDTLIEADVESTKTRAAGEIELEGVRTRAVERLAAEETKKQQNLEAIYGKAFQLLEPGVDSATIAKMDDDWIVFHSEKARLGSDKEMQTLWAKVMAKEALVPGSFCKRTLETLSVLEKQEAHWFTAVCQFLVKHSRGVSLVIKKEEGGLEVAKVYSDAGINFARLKHLTTIGLVEFTYPMLTDNLGYYDEPTIQLSYFEDQRTFRMSKTHAFRGKYVVRFGYAALTKVGGELAKIAGSTPIPGFFDFLEAVWEKDGIFRVRLQEAMKSAIQSSHDEDQKRS